MRVQAHPDCFRCFRKQMERTRKTMKQKRKRQRKEKQLDDESKDLASNKKIKRKWIQTM